MALFKKNCEEYAIIRSQGNECLTKSLFSEIIKDGGKCETFVTLLVT